MQSLQEISKMTLLGNEVRRSGIRFGIEVP